MKYKLIKGKGPVPEKTKLPIGSMVYVNKFMFKHEDLTAARLKNHEVGQHGRHTAAKNMDEFVQKYISINKVIKMPNGDWYVKNITPPPPITSTLRAISLYVRVCRVCICEDFAAQGCCACKCKALEQDGIININDLLRNIKPNATSGRPTKSAASLKRQPEAKAADSLLRDEPIAIVSQANWARKRLKGESSESGRQYVGRQVRLEP